MENIKYMIFAIDTHVEEFLFIFQYTEGTERNIVMPEIVKINNICCLRDYDFDFFEICENPNSTLNKEGTNIDDYHNIVDVMKKLDFVFENDEEKAFFYKKNKEILNILTKKSKSEILFILYQEGENHEILRKLFGK